MVTALSERVSALLGKVHRPSPAELATSLDELDVTVDEVLPYAGSPGIYPYGRKRLYASADVELLVMNWAAQRDCAPHDHGRSFGWIKVLAGTVRHTLYTLDQDDVPVPFLTRGERAGARYFAPRSMIHSMGNPSSDLMVTLHIYAPPVTGMRVYDLERCAACVVSDDCGAWWPADQRQLVQLIRLNRRTPASAGGGSR